MLLVNEWSTCLFNVSSGIFNTFNQLGECSLELTVWTGKLQMNTIGINKVSELNRNGFLDPLTFHLEPPVALSLVVCSTTLIQTEISQYLHDGFKHNFVH